MTVPLLRSESAAEEWPFQPWPARRQIGDWSSGRSHGASARSGGWSVLAFTALGAGALFGFAALAVVAMVQLQSDEGSATTRTMHRSAAGDAPSEASRLAALLRDHLRAVRGL